MLCSRTFKHLIVIEQLILRNHKGGDAHLRTRLDEHCMARKPSARLHRRMPICEIFRRLEAAPIQDLE